MGDEVVMQERKLRRRHLAAVSPPYSLVCEVVADDIFVLGAATRVYAGLGAERAAGRELGFTADNGAFVQFRLEKIPVQRLKISEAEFVCPEFRVADALLQHLVFSLNVAQPAHDMLTATGSLS
jgi:hypothetical protein